MAFFDLLHSFWLKLKAICFMDIFCHRCYYTTTIWSSFIPAKRNYFYDFYPKKKFRATIVINIHILYIITLKKILDKCVQNKLLTSLKRRSFFFFGTEKISLFSFQKVIIFQKIYDKFFPLSIVTQHACCCCLSLKTIDESNVTF